MAQRRHTRAILLKFARDRLVLTRRQTEVVEEQPGVWAVKEAEVA